MSTPRPFLKWAGGKRQLLPAIRGFYPGVFHGYFEPFVGTGAVFSDLWNSGKLADRDIRLTDVNADLIGCSLQVRDVEHVIAALEALARGHAAGGRTHYYEIRDTVFNPERDQWRERGGHATQYTPRLAAMLIYLNRTGYNGLFRQNAHGRLNVPAGEYTRPRIVNAGLLHAVSTVLRTPGVHVEEAPFESVETRAPATSSTSIRRTRRSRGRRSFAPTRRGDSTPAIKSACRRSPSRWRSAGYNVLLSNPIAPSILALYQSAASRSVGLRLRRVAARRAINSNATGRGAIEEVLVSNIRPAPVSQTSF